MRPSYAALEIVSVAFRWAWLADGPAGTSMRARERPKSISLRIPPASKQQFDGFRSRCTRPRECTCSSPGNLDRGLDRARHVHASLAHRVGPDASPWPIDAPVETLLACPPATASCVAIIGDLVRARGARLGAARASRRGALSLPPGGLRARPGGGGGVPCLEVVLEGARFAQLHLD